MDGSLPNQKCTQLTHISTLWHTTFHFEASAGSKLIRSSITFCSISHLWFFSHFLFPSYTIFTKLIAPGAFFAWIREKFGAKIEKGSPLQSSSSTFQPASFAIFNLHYLHHLLHFLAVVTLKHSHIFPENHRKEKATHIAYWILCIFWIENWTAPQSHLSCCGCTNNTFFTLD